MATKKKISANDLGLKGVTEGKEDLAPDSPASEMAQFWAQEITDARKREKHFRKTARKVVRIYEAEDGVEIPFNILYANTETLLPVLYSQPPRPVVKRRQRNNNDPKALVAARVAQRMLEYFLDTGLGESPGFDELAQRSCLQGIVSGRGLMRFRYEADIQKVQQPSKENPAVTEEVEQLKSECIAAEYVEWDRFLMGYARVWKQVPWIAFEHAMSRQELVDMFGEKLGRKIPLNMLTSEEGNDDSDEERDEQAPANSEGAKLAQVYEIWDRNKKEVVFYAPSYDKEILKTLPDPLGLSGFFPCSEPFMPFLRIRSMVPTPMYVFYRKQAEELNNITNRIDKIVNALKVRGFYDDSVKGMETLLEQDDNKLLPAQNVAAMQQGQTLEKSIWLMPLEKLTAVLQQLYVQRQQCKSLIYEITGLSDIIRGASAASETLGAQEIKQNWASIRIKRMQRAMMKYLRGNLRVMAELAVTKLGADTVTQMVGISLPTQEDKTQAQMQIQAQMQAQLQAPPPPALPAPPAPGAPPMAGSAGGPAPAPASAPKPPQPPQPDPKLIQTLQTPTMDEVLRLLRNDLTRSYYVDIETNSMLESEATEDKQQVGEFLNAMAQFLSGIAPLIQTKVMPFEAAQSILVNITRRYRMGDEVEEALQKMQPPQMPEDDKGKKDSGKDIEGEKQLMQAKVQMQQEELRIKRELGQLQIELEKMKLELEKQKMALETRKVADGHQSHQLEMQQKQELGHVKHQQALQQAMMPPAMSAMPAPAPAAPTNPQQGAE